jgi:hypothetical protein
MSYCPQVRPDAVELIRRDYSANSGWETFLAYEDPRQDVLVGLLRLRQVSGRSVKERQPELRGRWGCLNYASLSGLLHTWKFSGLYEFAGGQYCCVTHF